MARPHEAIVCYHHEVEGFSADTYGNGFADVYDDWYTDVSDAAATAQFVSARVPGPRVLELGVGSGRLVGSLVESGVDLFGLDAAAAMLRRCRERHPTLGLVRADMAVLPFADGSFDGALCAFNTLFNLASEQAQSAHLAEVARTLRPGGILVVEAMTGIGLDGAASSSVGVARMTTTQVVLTATMVDAANQTIAGQHIDLANDSIRLRPWQIRWTTPAQLDELSARAGLVLVERHADYLGAPFHEDSEAHVSVYRR